MSAAALKLIKGFKYFKAALNGLAEENGKGKQILIGLIGVVFLCIMLPVCAISVPGLSGKIESAEMFDLTQSRLFAEINNTYMDYCGQLDSKINRRKEELRRQYAYTVSVEDEKGKVSYETRYPDVIVTTDTDNLRFAPVFAYIAIKHCDMQNISEIERWVYDSKEIAALLEGILCYQEAVTHPYREKVELKVTVRMSDNHFIAEKYFTGQEQEMFLFSCETLSDFDKMENGASSDLDLKDLVFHENGMPIPHYLQYDPKWGGRSYGTGTISSSGCGPTCMAMVISYLTNNLIAPNVMAAWSSQNGFYVAGQGTAWSFYEKAAKAWGLKSRSVGKDYRAVVKALSDGNPVISSMSPGTFTRAGHFIVLRGITKTGKILVNDPNDNYRSKNFYKREFELDLIVRESKNFWIISK